MKKIFLLFILLSGSIYAQPPIAQPDDLIACDQDGDGTETFDLTFTLSQLYNGLDPSLYTEGFYTSLPDAQNDVSPIPNPSAYINSLNPETIYVRVFENANPSSFSITQFNLVVGEALDFEIVSWLTSLCDGQQLMFNLNILGTPNATVFFTMNGTTELSVDLDENGLFNQAVNFLVDTSTFCFTEIRSNTFPFCSQLLANPQCFNTVVFPNPDLEPSPDLIAYESSSDGIATFDLTVNESIMLNGMDPADFLDIKYYYKSLENPLINIEITNSTAFQNLVNNQTIYFYATSYQGCTSFVTFDLIVLEDAVVFIPDANFKTLLLNSSSNVGIATDTNFQPIVVDINQDNEIQFSEALLVHAIDIYDKNVSTIQGIEAFTNLVWFRCSKNNLTSVDLSSNINLDKLQIAENQLTSLDVSMLTNLVWLICNNNFLTSLNVLPLVNLEEFNCSYNQLTSIDVSTLSNIYTLDLSHNQLSTLNLNGSESVVQLNLQNNQLESLDLSNHSNAESAFLNFNNFSSIDVSPLQNLLSFGISDNQLTTLDLSQNPALVVVNCSNNNLESLFVKNGANEFSIVLDNNPLNFICADEFQIEAIQNQLTSIGNSSCVVNSYCSFTPGGDYNTITGNIRLDNNNNGCDETDFSIPFFRLAVDYNAMTTNSSVFSNNNGVYNLYTDTEGVYTLTPVIENPSYFTVSPEPGIAIIQEIDNSTTTLDFCITANGIHPDLEIVIAPVTPARPGFEAEYLIVYKNKGNQILSQQYGVNFFYNQNLMQLVSTSVLPSAQSPGGLQWDYANLMPFESRSIVVTMSINPPTDPENPVNINDVLTFASVILPQEGDDIVQDNTFVYNQTVVGSYDPNDITCLQGDVVSPVEIGNYLHYIVRFENTGTAPAENIVVKVEIEPNQFDYNSLQVLATSNDASVRMNANVVEFIFQNIQLESGGHGNILLKMKTNGTLQTGDYVEKRANIYFDYNFPIETNEAVTLFQALSVVNPVLDNLISIYPNPVKDSVNISIKENSTIKTIELYDIQGRLLQTKLVNDVISEINLAERANGMYFIKINTDKGSKVEKLVKE